MKAENEKRPRQWAAEISVLPTVEDRREKLQQVPAHLVPLVKTHLKILWDWKKFNAAQ